MDEIEYFFHCPYCGENISMLIDLNFNNQLYTEDCEVCCNPLEFDLSIENNYLKLFSVDPIDQ